MLFAKVKNVKFINQRCDVGARIAKRCRTQTNVRVVLSAVLLFAAVVIAPLASRTLVYASDDYTYTNTVSSVITAATDSTSLRNSSSSSARLVLDQSAVLDVFNASPGDTIKFKYKLTSSGAYSISGSPSFSTNVSGNVTSAATISYTPVGASSATTIDVYPDEEIVLLYGGGSISFDKTLTIGRTPYTQRIPFGTVIWYTYPGASWKTDFTYTIYDQKKVLSDNEALNDINDKMQEQIDQDKQFHDEENQKGEESGSDASQMVQNLTDQVKSKWEILFYPIEFTKKFLALFTSSSAGSTSLTFPAFSLEVQGTTYQVWDAYTYDLSSLKSQFSILFTGLHMIVGVLEVTWFIKYLYSKYDSIFGGGE